MKRFMYLSIGVLCLSLSALIGFHIGSRTAQAQQPGAVVGFTADQEITTNLPGPNITLMLDGGEVWWRTIGVKPDGTRFFEGDAPSHIGNFWGPGQPVPTSNNTWGAVKGLYDGEKK